MCAGIHSEAFADGAAWSATQSFIQVVAPTQFRKILQGGIVWAQDYEPPKEVGLGRRLPRTRVVETVGAAADSLWNASGPVFDRGIAQANSSLFIHTFCGSDSLVTQTAVGRHSLSKYVDRGQIVHVGVRPSAVLGRGARKRTTS